MARQFQGYDPEFQKLSSNATSPSSPYPRGDTPISFRTNVNRAKTKRWVEAKKYSYDGNDWGDDDDEEDEEEPPPPLPISNPANRSTGNLPSTLAPGYPPGRGTNLDRSRSSDHVATLGAPDASRANRSQSADRDETSSPIVRPADIYKRMRQSPADQSLNSPPVGLKSAPAVGGDPAQDTASQGQSQQQFPNAPTVPSASQKDTPILSLPDVKRLSGFGTGLLSGTSPTSPTAPQANQQEPALQHNPSLGFRSVVHQAFDAETPDSNEESVQRSNSDSTSLISPIMPHRQQSDNKTPTIQEEPEAATPPGFIPGHRRDLSVPSPGNSPSRKPQIVTNDVPPTSALAETSSSTPYTFSRDPSELHLSNPNPPNMSEHDRPAPLSFGGSPTGPDAPSLPVIVPSLSADNSPQDTENDRLRKEIIRSLSRENTPSEDPEQPAQPDAARHDSLIPSEYERYWSEDVTASPKDEKPGDQRSPEISTDPPAAAAAATVPASEPEPKPKLTRKFSWESTSSEEPAPPLTTVQSPPVGPIPGGFPGGPPDTSAQPEPQSADRAPPTDGEQESDHPPPMEKPKLTIIPPSTVDSGSIVSDRQLPEVVNPVSAGAGAGATSGSGPVDTRTLLPEPTESPSLEPTLQGFRDIMNLPTPSDRVAAFNRTREQFGSIDTGLNRWIRVIVHEHPEHMDVVAKSQKQSTGEAKVVVSRSKFPKLPSLGNLAGSAAHGDGAAPGAGGHVRRSSAPLNHMINKQEQRGKDLLHTAGRSAKGLFAKGRSKFNRGEKEA